MWYHLNGTEELTCISGFYQDRTLPELPSTLTRWNNWLSQFPETFFLDYP